MTLKHLRSSTADKRPQASGMVDGQLAMNTASGSPGLFFKDNAGTVVKIGPVHVGSGAPNASPASGGTTGNSIGEQWLDTSGGTYIFKVWDGAAWRSEAGEFVNATGDTMTGSLTMGASADIIFEGSVDDGFETTLTVANPTTDRTITLPNITGTVVTTGDTGSVTSTMIADDTIVNADVNASAAIAGTKISPDFGSQNVTTTGTSTAASFIPTSGTVPTDGVYLPAASNVAISTNSSQRLRIDSVGTTTLTSAASTAPFIAKISTTEVARIDSSGRLLVGSSSARANFSNATTTPQFQVEGTTASLSSAALIANGNASTINPYARLFLGRSRGALGTNTVVIDSDALGAISYQGNDGTEFVEAASIAAFVDGTPGADDMPGRLVFSTTADGASSPTERMRITSAGNVGIGTTSTITYGGKVVIVDGAVGGETTLVLANNSQDQFVRLGINNNDAQIAWDNADSLVFGTASTSATAGLTNEYARIDSSGRLLVGTSSAVSAPDPEGIQRSGSLQIAANTFAGSQSLTAFYGISVASAGSYNFARSQSTTVGTHQVVVSNGPLGFLNWSGSDGTNFIRAASIFAAVDGTPGANDMPGRIVLSTTADGASSPTERLRITSAGNVGIGTTSPAYVLDVVSNDTTANIGYALRVRANDTALASAIQFTNSGGTTQSALISATTSTNASPRVITFNALGGFIATLGSAEAARIDSSGRLLVGTSSALSVNNVTAGVEVHSTATNNGASVSIARFNNDTSGPQLILGKSRNATVAAGTIVQNNDELGQLVFNGDDGTDLNTPAARIQAFVDGTPGLNDMPGRIVLSTTLDGASSPTERLRITNDGVQAYNQPEPAAVNATATLTVANLKAGIITSTSAAATDMTLPTGTDTEAGFSGVYTNFTFEWSVINTGPSLVRVLAGTAHTIVGAGSVATGTSARFASRRTAANTFVTYRLS